MRTVVDSRFAQGLLQGFEARFFVAAALVVVYRDGIASLAAE